MTAGIVSKEAIEADVDSYALRQAQSMCERIVPVVMDVAWLLRDHPAGAVAVFESLTDREVRAFAMVAAAAIDVDASPSELLGWTRARMVPPLMPCGTHAAFNRHKHNGEDPCQACWEAERAYQRGRTRGRQQKRAPGSELPDATAAALAAGMSGWT